MKPTKQMYWDERKLGFPALRAWSNAKTRLKFGWYEKLGLVQFKVLPETHPHDASYVDTWGVSEGRKKRIKGQIFGRLLDEGHWYIASFVKCEGRMVELDAVHDFIGKDWENSGYDVDVMQSAILEIEAMQSKSKAAAALELKCNQLLAMLGNLIATHEMDPPKELAEKIWIAAKIMHQNFSL